MTSTTPIMPNATPDRLLALVNQAFDLVRDGARGAAEFFAHNHNGAVNDVSECERELDRLDREFDDQLGAALAGADPKRVTELVAGLKLMVDLERIGDLLLSSVTTGNAVAAKLEPEELHDFIRMCSILEKTVASVHDAYRKRNLQEAMQVLKADAEIDRLRNLIVMRQLEGSSPSAPHAVHVVAIAQALERAGDHIRNLAEEIAHLCTGRSLRHAQRAGQKSDEQMYIERMRKQYRR
jgi:phosphate transport system protein